MASETKATTQTPIRTAEEYSTEIELDCRPGQDEHTQPPCRRCERIRDRLVPAIEAALRDERAREAFRNEQRLRRQILAANEYVATKNLYELLKKAFRKLRVVLNLEPAEAGRLVHEAWIGLMLERGFHPFQECPSERPCESCDNELMPWDDLPVDRRAAREAGVEALFRELRRRAGTDEMDAQDLAGVQAVKDMRAAAAKERTEQDAAAAASESRQAQEAQERAKAEEGAP